MFPRPKQSCWPVALIVIFFSFFILYSPFSILLADDNKCNNAASLTDLNEIKQCSDAFSKSLQLSIGATKPLEGQLDSLKRQLAQIQASLQNLSVGIASKEKELRVREDKLVVQQALLSSRVRSYYIRSFLASPFIVILSQARSGDIFRDLSYREAATREDQRVISQVTSEMIDLLKQKDKLEKDKASLAFLQEQVDKNATFLNGEIGKAKAYQSDLSNKISQLSARQQQIIAEKLGSLNIPLYAYNTQGGCSSDISPYKDPGFGGAKFALFTYGVPNRVGLNQYGAWGRAKAGQDADTILHAYYNFDSYQNMNVTIKVNDGNGFNTGNIIWSGGLDDYVKRIYEVPDNWTDNNLAALKAQAIAARSYAVAATDNGNISICANQHCQVFKTDPKGGNWDSAVGQTAGQVMIQGGQPVKAWFSSTHGGYEYTSGEIGWNNKPWTKHMTDSSGSVGSFSDLNNNAYDKDSPWFYCDWGGRKSYNNTAWLTSSEMADIVNSILLVQSDGSADSHILQTDKSDPNTWSEDKVRQELSRFRTPFNSISSASVSADFGSGRTVKVSFSGDAGSTDFDSDVFKKYFNLRAPSNINIVGPLFNVEKR